MTGVFFSCFISGNDRLDKREIEVIKMRDRLEPCIYYVCKDADCKKGFVKVDLKKCKNCPKYRPRKNNQKKESVRDKRQKDKDRHDQWKKDKF